MRQCVKCDKNTDQGYIFDGSDVYCSDECLSTVASPEKWERLHDKDPDYFYWTTFEDEDEDEDEDIEEDYDDHYCPDFREDGTIDDGRHPMDDPQLRNLYNNDMW